MVKTIFSRIVLFWIALTITGCEAFNPKPLDLANMVPRDPQLVFTPSSKTIAIGKFKGWREKSELVYKLSIYDLKRSVIEGLKHSRLFETVYNTDQYNSDYMLSARILAQPMDAFISVKANLIVEYKITQASNGETVFKKRIASEKVVTGSDEFAGITRMRKAVEGAMRNNVKLFLEAISKIAF